MPNVPSQAKERRRKPQLLFPATGKAGIGRVEEDVVALTQGDGSDAGIPAVSLWKLQDGSGAAASGKAAARSMMPLASPSLSKGTKQPPGCSLHGPNTGKSVLPIGTPPPARLNPMELRHSFPSRAPEPFGMKGTNPVLVPRGFSSPPCFILHLTPWL